jgi:tetratricopeptide (TPR) repeat protein
LRTYKAIAYLIGQAEVTLSLGNLQVLRGSLDRAIQTYEEASKLGQSLSNALVKSNALLGLGTIQGNKGQTVKARNSLNEAQKILENHPSDPAYSITALEIMVRKAQIALFTGQLDEAAKSLAMAYSMISEYAFTSHVEPAILLIDGQLLLTQGDFTGAESRFSEAYSQSEVLQETLLAARAILGIAQTRLSRKELDAASASFVEAGRQFQLLESVDGDGEACLGIAQTLIGKGEWNDALEHCDVAKTRFHQSGNQIGEADEIFTTGLAYRGNDSLQEAASNFEQAVQLYQAYHLPLQEADALYERAGVFIQDNRLDDALHDFTRAISLVEEVMHTLSKAEQWNTFLRQYTELYAQTAIIQVRSNHESEALSTLSSFIRITGRDLIQHYLQDYENSILATSDDVSEDEAQANSKLVKRLRTLRKNL